jgi:hypothetical protein
MTGKGARLGETAVPIMILARVSKTTYGRGGKRYYAPIYAGVLGEEWWKQE